MNTDLELNPFVVAHRKCEKYRRAMETARLTLGAEHPEWETSRVEAEALKQLANQEPTEAERFDGIRGAQMLAMAGRRQHNVLADIRGDYLK